MHGNEITVFVNCKIPDSSGNILGVVGVGIRISYLKDFLESYEDKYNMDICLIDKEGKIEISTTHTGYSKTDWFEYSGHGSIRDGKVWNMSASIGIAVIGRDDISFDELFELADSALYSTKQKGKNGYTIYEG